MAKQAEATPMTKLESFWDALGNKEESTKSGYRSAILKFISFIYPDATKDTCEEYVEKYFSSDRNYFNDFKKFIQTNLADSPTLSALQKFNQVKNFFSLCDVNFTPKEVKLLKNQLPNGGIGDPETQEIDLDPETIRAILQHCDVKMKAIILCLASGGMRIGELLNVRCADLDLNSIPAVIQIRAKHASGKKNKTSTQRYTFISSEAVSAIREWNKIRPAYLLEATKMGKNFRTKELTVNPDDERLFPISDNSVNNAFKSAVIAVFGKNEVDPTTKRSVRHIHQFRKFFESQVETVTSRSIAEFLTGHKDGLSAHYRRYTTKQMAEYYIKSEHMLYIEAPKELREATSSTKKEIAEMQKNAQKTTSTLVNLLAREAELKDTIKKQQEQIALLNEKYAGIEEVAKLMRRFLKRVDLEKLPYEMGDEQFEERIAALKQT
jgi:integrase